MVIRKWFVNFEICESDSRRFEVSLVFTQIVKEHEYNSS